MNMKRLLLLTAVACSLAAVPAAADCPLTNPDDCIYVDVVNCSDPGDGTQGDPFCTIQEAYDHAVTLGTSPGDVETILVMPGTYNECVAALGTSSSGTSCDCCTKNGLGDPLTGCDCPPCESVVCAIDDFCCVTLWDDVCDAIATDDCTCCAGQDPGVCVTDINAPVHFVADAWLNAGSPSPVHADPTSFETIAQQTTLTGTDICDPASGTPRAALAIGGTGASVEGMAITDGGLSGVEAHGGVTVANNLVYQNRGDLGGGVGLTTEVCFYGDVTASISRNVVRDNLADDFADAGVGWGAGDGGGIFVLADGEETGPECTGGRSEVSISDNLIFDNTAQNLVIDFDALDRFAGGGGIWIETSTYIPAGDPALSEALVRVSGNTIRNNRVEAGEGFALGGGIGSQTLGFGRETIEVVDYNNIGPGNLATASVVAAFGGGVSASVTPFNLGLHETTIDGNTVFQNQADFGGGLDLLLDVDTMLTDQVARLLATGNLIEDNEAFFDGGGISAALSSARTVDSEQAAQFPSALEVAEDVSLIVQGNVVSGNLAGGGGAGALLQPNADGDPLNLGPANCSIPLVGSAGAEIEFVNNLVEGNTSSNVFLIGGCSDNVCEDIICAIDPVCCVVGWDQICADEALAEPVCDAECGTSDCCGVVAPKEAVGAGVFVNLRAKGDAVAWASFETSTIIDNAMAPVGFTGGVEASAATIPDCIDLSVGQAVLDIDRSIVGDNAYFGVGGPDPAENDLVPVVTKSSVYDNGGNGSALQYQDTLFPGGTAPDGNILDDPLLDPGSFVPDLCSTVYDVGSCEAVPATVCFDDADCVSPDVCVAEGAGWLANPDLNEDGALDGVDLVRFSTAFGAEEGEDTRYNAGADIDRNGQVEGRDLPYIVPLFGQACTTPGP
jgi:hypothetical protein